MTTPIKIKPLHIEANRKFHWAQRSSSFVEFQQSLHRLHIDLNNVLLPGTLEGLLVLKGSLNICLEHSRSAISGMKRGYFKAYRDDQKNGVLEEEHLLVSILDEILQSSKFLISRLETEHRMSAYRSSLDSNKSEDVDTGFHGFLSNLLQSLDELSSTSTPEILQIFSIIIERATIAEFLFQQLNEKVHG